MDNEERQRTMDFILQQQAQFSAGMQRLEEQQTQFAASQQRTNGRLDQLERIVLLMARQFRRERRDLCERISALVDAQLRTEEISRQNSEAIRALTKVIDEKNQSGSGNGDNP
jgi:hypothetical protein